MASWDERVTVKVGRYIEPATDKEPIIKIEIMYDEPTDNDFVCELCFPHPSKLEEISLARIDTSHGYLHLDKLWKEEKEKQKLHKEMDAWEAAKYLQENWQSYFKKWSNRKDNEVSEVYKLENLE